MSQVTNSSAYIFNTDVGNVLIEIQTRKGYDVEDVVRDKAFSQAQLQRFTNIANNIDVNALVGTRAIQSSFLTGE